MRSVRCETLINCTHVMMLVINCQQYFVNKETSRFQFLTFSSFQMKSRNDLLQMLYKYDCLWLIQVWDDIETITHINQQFAFLINIQSLDDYPPSWPALLNQCFIQFSRQSKWHCWSNLRTLIIIFIIHDKTQELVHHQEQRQLLR